MFAGVRKPPKSGEHAVLVGVRKPRGEQAVLVGVRKTRSEQAMFAGVRKTRGEVSRPCWLG